MYNFTLLTVIIENISTLTNVTIIYNYNGNSNLWQVISNGKRIGKETKCKKISNSNDNN